MLSKLGLTAAALLCLAGFAWADPIEGSWRTKSGAIATIAPCSGAFCITLKTGKHAGKSIGRLLAGATGSYSGEITDPNSDKTYSGKAALSGARLKLSGCVLGGLICRGENWSRQ